MPFYPNDFQQQAGGLFSVGDVLNDGSVVESEAIKAAQLMVSAIVGAVWKNEAKTFRLEPTAEMIIDTEVKNYFKTVNSRVTSAMEHPKARFLEALIASILDAVIYGTGGTAEHQGTYSSPLRFQNKSPFSFYVGYNKLGEIDTIIVDYYYTAKELVNGYPEVDMGSAVRNAFTRNDQTTRFILSQVVTPRKEKKADIGKLAMPYASYVFLPDHNVMLDEGGYESLPLRVLFYRRLEQESYGRGIGMDALPTVIQSHIAGEILAVGGECTALPTMGMYDDGSLAGKTVNLSSGVLNVFNVMGGAFPTEKPIFPIYTVGDLSVMFEWWKLLRERIYEFFLLDKLYDANQNPVQRTLGESIMQNSIRSDALSPVFTRVMHFIDELIDK
jgi:hypothetical protein